MAVRKIISAFILAGMLFTMGGCAKEVSNGYATYSVPKGFMRFEKKSDSSVKYKECYVNDNLELIFSVYEMSDDKKAEIDKTVGNCSVVKRTEVDGVPGKAYYGIDRIYTVVEEDDLIYMVRLKRLNGELKDDDVAVLKDYLSEMQLLQ